MADLVPWTGSLLAPSRIERQTGRAVARVQARQAVVTAQQIGRVETIADVTEAALLATSHIAALESLLVTRTPRAEERLRHISDAAALGMTEIVLTASRRCR
jgi:hypothetical protein